MCWHLMNKDTTLGLVINFKVIYRSSRSLTNNGQGFAMLNHTIGGRKA